MSNDNAVELDQMTWPEVQERLEEARVAIIPVGSTEQHGPHLALATDTTRAHRFSVRLAEHLYPRVLVAPPIPVGISAHHMGFPGSMTLRPETLMQLLMDYVGSLMQHGLEKFFIITGHGGNEDTISVATEIMRDELGLVIPHVNYKTFTSDITREIIASGRIDHAGEWEVSDAMFLAPELVREDELTDCGEGAAPWKYTELQSEFRIKYPIDWQELTSNGVMGDAREASHEKGRQINDRALERAAEFLRDFLADN